MTETLRYVSISEFSEHDVVDGHTEHRGAVNSPKSVAAMRKCCITDADLRVRAFEEFSLTPAEREQIGDEDLCRAFQYARFEEYLRRRKSAIQLVSEVRKQIIREEQSREVCRQRVAKQLSTLSGESKKSPKKKAAAAGMGEAEPEPLPAMQIHKKNVTKELLALIKAYHREDEARREIIKKEKGRLMEHKKKVAQQQNSDQELKNTHIRENELRAGEVRRRAQQLREEAYQASLDAYSQKVQRMQERKTTAELQQQENTILAQKQLQQKAALTNQLAETVETIQKREQVKIAAAIAAAQAKASASADAAASASPPAAGTGKDKDEEMEEDVNKALKLCSDLSPEHWRRQTSIPSPSSLNRPAIWPPMKTIAVDPMNSPSRIRHELQEKQSRAGSRAGDRLPHPPPLPPGAKGGANEDGEVKVKDPKKVLQKKREAIKKRAEELTIKQMREAGQQWARKQAKLKELKGENEHDDMKPEDRERQQYLERIMKERKQEREKRLIKLRFLKAEEKRQEALIKLAGQKFSKADQVKDTRAIKQLMRKEENALRDDWRQDQLNRVNMIQKLKEDDILSSIKEREEKLKHWKNHKEHEEHEKRMIQEAYILANQKIKNTLHVKAPREVAHDLQGALQMVYKQADKLETVLTASAKTNH